mmetsp:Transcript_5229/g.11436  ORF Transcript_5229/g.11436 Transcript_5229/m.11436 type:complete len:250 (-) Transcript_5229:1510-2259(-)
MLGRRPIQAGVPPQAATMLLYTVWAHAFNTTSCYGVKLLEVSRCGRLTAGLRLARNLQLVEPLDGPAPDHGCTVREVAHGIDQVMCHEQAEVAVVERHTLSSAPGCGQQCQLPKEAACLQHGQHLRVAVEHCHCALCDEVHLMAHIPYPEDDLPRQVHAELQAHHQSLEEGLLAFLEQGDLLHQICVHPGGYVLEHAAGQLGHELHAVRARVRVLGQVLKVVVNPLRHIVGGVEVPDCVIDDVLLELVS